MVFFFGHALQFSGRLPLFRLRGLDPQGRYEMESYGKPEDDDEKYGKPLYDVKEDLNGSCSGAGLMSIGIRPFLTGDFASRIIHIKRKDQAE